MFAIVKSCVFGGGACLEGLPGADCALFAYVNTRLPCVDMLPRLGYEMAKVSAEATSQAPTPALASAAAAAQSDELKQVLADAAERSIQAVDAAVKSAVADQSTRSSQQLAAVVSLLFG